MGIFSPVKSFVVENFWLPAQGIAEPYNIFNTSVYAGLFAVTAAYLGFPLLKKMDVELDRRFFTGITPFIFLGGAVRVLEDLKMVDSILLVTPFIYFVMFGLFVSLLLTCIRLFGDDYHQPLAGAGSILLLAVLGLYSYSNFTALGITLGVLGAVLVPGYAILKYFRPELLTYSFGIPIAAHYWDASTTITALSFGASEKHVLAGFFIDLMGPAGMLAMKTLVIVPAVYYIDTEMEGEEKRYYLFLIALLGIALGTRNILSVLSA